MERISSWLGNLFITLSSVLLLVACYRGAAPPSPVYPGDGGPPTIRMHCSIAANLGSKRAHRWEIFRWLAVGGAASALASMPTLQASDDRSMRVALGTVLSVAAISGVAVAVVGDRHAKHHRAMAVGFAACADIDDEVVAQMIAGEIYRLSIRSSVSAADVAAVLGRVLRDPSAAFPIDQGPTEPPPSPPSNRPFGPHGQRDALSVEFENERLSTEPPIAL